MAGAENSCAEDCCCASDLSRLAVARSAPQQLTTPAERSNNLQRTSGAAAERLPHTDAGRDFSHLGLRPSPLAGILCSPSRRIRGSRRRSHPQMFPPSPGMEAGYAWRSPHDHPPLFEVCPRLTRAGDACRLRAEVRTEHARHGRQQRQPAGLEPRRAAQGQIHRRPTSSRRPRRPRRSRRRPRPETETPKPRRPRPPRRPHRPRPCPRAPGSSPWLRAHVRDRDGPRSGPVDRRAVVG
jgi:hypothetical protein